MPSAASVIRGFAESAKRGHQKSLDGSQAHDDGRFCSQLFEEVELRLAGAVQGGRQISTCQMILLQLVPNLRLSRKLNVAG